MAVTIEDIAREANVSIATVSRVINHTKAVSPELYERVTKVVHKMNFRPNTLARGLITKRTGTIGVVIADISNPVFGTLTKGINSVCQDMDYTVIICESDGKRDKELALLQKLTEQRIDGVLFAGVEVDESLVEHMRRMEYPIVLMTQEETGGKSTMTTIGHDNTRAIYDAMTFLTSHGHRRIAFIGGPEHDYSSGIRRLEGYRMALADYGLEVPDSYVVHGDFTFDSGYGCMGRIYEESIQLPTAVMVCSDLMAVGAMQYARIMNLRIPEDISIMGFDDSPSAAYSVPALSTVRISYFDEGVEAAHALFALLDKTEEAPVAATHYIPYKVIRRNSVARIGEPLRLRAPSETEK